MSISEGEGGAARGKGKHSLCVASMNVDDVCARADRRNGCSHAEVVHSL